MLRSLLLALLVTAPALAQSDPALAPTAAHFHDDVTGVTAMLATAALVHDATGAFPTSPYGLLGSAEAGRTDLRTRALSEITVDAEGDRLTIRYVPLPVDPYVSEDRIVRLDVTVDQAGLYSATYEIVRRADPDMGGRRLPYDQTGRYRVDRASGTACVDVATVRERLAAGTFTPEPGTLGPRPLTIRVVPLGEEAPVLYEESR